MKTKTILISTALLLAVSAQGQTITQRLQSRVRGQGVVNVYQSDSVSAVVNGKPAKQAEQQATPARKAKSTPQGQSPQGQNQQQAQQQQQPRQPEGGKTAPDNKAQQEPNVPAGETRPVLGDSITVNMPGLVRGGRKMMGYRVQAFAGGNSRKDRAKAESVKNRVKSILPGEPVYVHFISPRWTCRVGNYRSYEEASQVLHTIRAAGISGANVVKSQIIVKSEE